MPVIKLQHIVSVTSEDKVNMSGLFTLVVYKLVQLHVHVNIEHALSKYCRSHLCMYMFVRYI